MRMLLEYRVVLSLAVSAVAGGVGLHIYPFPADNPILGLVRIERPVVYAGVSYTYAPLWVTTPFLLARFRGLPPNLALNSSGPRPENEPRRGL